LDNIINLFEKDPQFNPTILVIPYDTCGSSHIFDKGLNKSQLQEYDDNYKYFEKKGFNVIKGYDNKLKAFIDIESKLNPDIVFYSTPWEAAFPEQYRIQNLSKNILFCYIPYGIHSSYIVEGQFNRELHKNAWKIFYPTQIHKELAAKYSDVGSTNVVVTGYPKMDLIINRTHERNPYPWKDSKHLQKRVIWAPHYSTNWSICFSTFHKNYQFFYDFAKDHSEIEWVFKPHPALRHNNLIYSSIVSEEDSFNYENLEKYYNSWNNLPNATVYERGDYQNMFATSDAMITDCSSFLSEYLYSGNPGLFLTNLTQKFNEYGEIIKNAWYQIDGTDFKKIENFINDVVINEEDPLKTTRENIYNRYLKMDGLASEKIYNYIKSSLTAENEHE
jgi:UDP-N-acetylglucosamine 2-epimerase